MLSFFNLLLNSMKQYLIKTFDYNFGDENLCRLIYDKYLKVITIDIVYDDDDGDTQLKQIS